MHRDRRITAILDRLAKGSEVQIDELVEDLQVSAATVRRDLRYLETQNLLKRSRGGAVAQSLLYQLPARYSADDQREAKRQIAKAAVAGLTPGLTVGLTGGTTTTEVARALVGIDHLTVVTNALNIAGELAIRPTIKLVVTGGVVRSESYELVGPMAEGNLNEFNLDVVFVGIDGLTADRGACIRHDLEAQTSKVMMKRSARTVIVADQTKLGKVAFARLCGISEIDELITNSTAAGPALAQLEAAGLRVTLAP